MISTDQFQTSAECVEMARACLAEARRLHQFSAPWALDNRRAQVANAGAFRLRALTLAAAGR